MNNLTDGVDVIGKVFQVGFVAFPENIGRHQWDVGKQFEEFTFGVLPGSSGTVMGCKQNYPWIIQAAAFRHPGMKHFHL